MRVQDEKIIGFNILELIIVLVIIGVISGLGYPEFSKWQLMTKNKLLDSIVPFKSRVYENILSQFSAQLNLK